MNWIISFFVIFVLIVVLVSIGNDTITYQNNLAKSIISDINCDNLHKNGNQVYYELYYELQKDITFKRNQAVYDHIDKLVKECEK